MSRKARLPSPPRVNPEPVTKVGRSERTRAAILNAALDSLWSHRFRDMTVSSVMASTGLSRSAFYQYFGDLNELMETLLSLLQVEIFDVAEPWIAGVGDPVALLHEAIAGLVRIAHQRGPIYRAFADAAATDKCSEGAWGKFLGAFDDAGCARIEADQQQGLIPRFDARPVAIALNRLDADTLIEAFGQHPMSEPEPVRKALARIWISTLYGSEWVGKESSDLVRR